MTQVTQLDTRILVKCSTQTFLPDSARQQICVNTKSKSKTDEQFFLSLDDAESPPQDSSPTTLCSCLCRLKYAPLHCSKCHTVLPQWLGKSPFFSQMQSLLPVEIVDVMSPMNWVATYCVFNVVLLAPTIHFLRWCCRGAAPLGALAAQKKIT
jgi:hypothetical protein